MFGFDSVHNGFKRFACSTANIEEIALREGHVVDKRKVGGNGEEGADEEVIESSSEALEHINNFKITRTIINFHQH